MDTPVGTPELLADLVAYQPGSVVSRVLARTEGAVQTLFAFAEGEGLTEHTSPHEATVLVLEGSVRITVGDETEDPEEHRVGSGEMLHLPGTVPHALHGDERFKMLLTLLKNPV